MICNFACEYYIMFIYFCNSASQVQVEQYGSCLLKIMPLYSTAKALYYRYLKTKYVFYGGLFYWPLIQKVREKKKKC